MIQPGGRLLSPLAGMLIGATLISFSSVVVRASEVPPSTSAFYRVAIGFVVLLVWLWLRGSVRSAWAGFGNPVVILAAFFFAADLLCWHRSIFFIGPGLATLLANLQVVIIPLLAWLAWREPLSRSQSVAVPLALLGLGLMVGPAWSEVSPSYRAGVWLALLTAVFYSIYILALRRAGSAASRGSSTSALTVVSAISALFLAASFSVTGDSFVLETPAQLGWMLVYGAVCHVGGWVLIAAALPRIGAATAGLALIAQPVLSMFWDLVFFQRVFTVPEAMGAAVCVLAIFIGTGTLTRVLSPG